MKYILLITLASLFFSFSNHQNEDPYHIQVNILVDDEPWSKRQTIDEESIITVQLESINKDNQYNFEQVSVQWVLERQRVGRKNKKKLKRNFLVGRVKTFNVHPKKRLTTQEGLADCYDCEKYDLEDQIGAYQGFSKNPKIVFPYKKFYDPCLSRIILKIEKLQVKTPDGKIRRVRNFAYKKDFSLRPRWSRCKDVDYNSRQGSK